MTNEYSDSNEFWVGVACFMLSFAVNTGAMVSLGRTDVGFQTMQQQLAAARNRDLQLEFIEAPEQGGIEKARNTLKISNRDVVSQDLKPHKIKTARLPYVRKLGPADQLAQRRGSLPRVAVPSVPKPPAVPAPPKEPVPAQEAAKPAPETAAPKPAAEKPMEMTEGLKLKPIEQPAAPPPALAPAPKPAVPQDAIKPIEEVLGGPKAEAPAPPKAPGQKAEGLTGQDKIDTNEMGKVKSPGAHFEGMTSFEATGSGMGEYMKNVKEKVWLSWFPYLAFKYPMDFKNADVVLSITLDAAGQVKMVRIVESEGSPVFAQFCMEAIQRASGFGPLPKEILAIVGKDELEIRFAFHYR
jgi:TonB family protein